MKISEARVLYFKIPECSMLYPDGTKIDMPALSVTDDRAFESFMREAKKGITINDLIDEEHSIVMEASGTNSFFEIKITYGSVEIVWNKYSGKAWYERDEWKNKGNTEE